MVYCRYTVQKKYFQKILVKILKKDLQGRPNSSSSLVLRKTETVNWKIFIKICSIATSLKDKSLAGIFLRNLSD